LSGEDNKGLRARITSKGRKSLKVAALSLCTDKIKGFRRRGHIKKKKKGKIGKNRNAQKKTYRTGERIRRSVRNNRETVLN